MRRALIMAFLVSVGWSRAEAAPYVDETVQDQWFTGSLEAPSPALPKAGLFLIEPYAVYTGNIGAYDSCGDYHSVAHELNQAESVTVLKYGITDRLTVQAAPAFSYLWSDQTTSRGVQPGDLPVELQYRLKDESRKTAAPSVTIDLGMIFPVGAYDRLHTPLDGVGSGAYTAKEGVLLQSLFDTWGNHPMRLRFFGDAYEPVAKVSVQDVSVYGTAQGFEGQARPGFSADVGLGAEYGLDQRWVLALDLVGNYANGYRATGTNAAGDAVLSIGTSSRSVSLAPAIEYNWSNNMGVIVGVEFSAAGRNAASYVAPQVAVSMGF